MFPHGEDLIWSMVILSCTIFIGWWPYHCLKQDIAKREPQPEECPRCGRMVETIEMHIKRCTGQPARRNPHSGLGSFIYKSFKKGENVDVFGPPAPKNDDELEQL